MKSIPFISPGTLTKSWFDKDLNMKSALFNFFFLKGTATAVGFGSSFFGSSNIFSCSSIFGGSSTGLIFSALVTSIILAEFLVGVFYADNSSFKTTGEVNSW